MNSFQRTFQTELGKLSLPSSTVRLYSFPPFQNLEFKSPVQSLDSKAQTLFSSLLLKQSEPRISQPKACPRA